MCAACSVDAHELFEHVKRLATKSERKVPRTEFPRPPHDPNSNPKEALLANGSFKNLTANRIHTIITQPKEGWFWEA